MTTYEIIRFYSPKNGKKARKIMGGLTEEEAKEHCNDPKTRKEGFEVEPTGEILKKYGKEAYNAGKTNNN